MRSVLIAAAAAGPLFALAGQSAATVISFSSTGVLPGLTESLAYDVSNNAIAVGGSYLSDGSGFRSTQWSPGVGLTPLTIPFGSSASAAKINADGSVMVGASGDGFSTSRAVRWHSSGITDDLGVLSGMSNSHAKGVSPDGSVVVGDSGAGAAAHAFRWTSPGGMEDLGVPAGMDNSFGTGVNADGSVVVGYGHSLQTGASRAFRWTASGGMQDLGGQGDSFAQGTSDDGSVVVGYRGSAHTAFRWTTSSGMQSLPQLVGAFQSQAYDVSGDGQFAVGDSLTDQWRAVLWTPSGPLDLNTYLPTLGVDLSGWILIQANGISDDGHTITGEGFINGHRRGWVAVIPAPGGVTVLALGLPFCRRPRRQV